VNSLLGLLPPSYLLTTPVSEIFNDINLTAGIQGVYNAPGTLPPFPNTQSLLATIGMLLLAAPLNLGTPPQLFLTLQNNDLPILAPLRLPAQLINAALDGLAAAFAPPGSAGAVPAGYAYRRHFAARPEDPRQHRLPRCGDAH